MADNQETNEQNFDDLAAFASGSSGQYLKFDESNVPIEGMFTGFFFDEDKFNPGKQSVTYKIEINQEEKYLTSSSKRLANAIIKNKPKVGDFIKITRVLGDTPYDTTYEVETSDIPF